MGTINLKTMVYKWNEMNGGFKPPLRTYRLNWARRASWGWWDEWDEPALHTGFEIRTQGALRASTLPRGHGGSPQYWVLRVYGEETFLFLSNRRDRETQWAQWTFRLWYTFFSCSHSYTLDLILPYFFSRTTNGLDVPQHIYANEMNRALGHLCAHIG